MHVDGFRFDLAPTLARRSDTFDPRSAFLAVVGQDPVLSEVKLIAEPWDVGPGGYQLGHFPPPWAEWNDRYRDAVRDVWLADNARKHGSGVRDLAYRLTGSSDVFGGSGRGPLSSVNFVTAHDGFTLRDLVTYEHKHNESNGEDNRDGHDHNRSWNCGVEGPTDLPEVRSVRRRMMRNLLATLTLSTGVPMMTAGDETGRTQDGNNNAYSVAIPGPADSSARPAAYPVDWELGAEAPDLLTWSRALLSLRRDHPVLRQDEFFEGRTLRDDGIEHSLGDVNWFGAGGSELTAEAWFDHDLRVLGMHLVASTAGDPSNAEDTSNALGGSSLLVLVNTGPDEERFTLPGAPHATSYQPLLDTTDEQPGPPGPEMHAGEAVVLTPHSIQVLASSR
jgi:isoamylase